MTGGNPNYSHVGTSEGPFMPAPLARFQSNIPPETQRAKPYLILLMRGGQTRFYSNWPDFERELAQFVRLKVPHLAFHFLETEYVLHYPAKENIP